ncbi:MAG TPA: efflux RND transporter periplasmic adaptor subunit [Gemmatimonadales bacterium]|nr:efflux RND transporter periplasmic adaptor subunit [Gemmatimonadales bacterium]
MRPTITHAALALALGAAACGKDAEGAGGGPGGGGMPALPVETAEARRDTVVELINATGAMEALQSILLKPEVDGRITQILVRDGAVVGAGAGLFRIDDAELRAQVDRAEAEYDLATQALERTKTLIEQNASSQADLERAEATARSTRAALELLRIRLARTTVRAPFGGVVGGRTVSLGDYVTNSTDLISLQTVDPMRAAFDLPERYAEQVEVGQAIEFQVAALPGQTFRGVVDFVDPVVRLPGRSILVKARVPNPRGALQPGMFVEVRLATDVRPAAVVVPEEAVVGTQMGTVVWVVKDGKVERREVTLGVRTPGQVEIRNGVAAGEAVVVGGQAMLQPGAPVMARPKGAPAQPPGAAADTAVPADSAR